MTASRSGPYTEIVSRGLYVEGIVKYVLQERR